MANIIASEQRKRSQAFDYLVDKQFDVFPGGRETFCREVGEAAIKLMPVIDNYFLPNVKNGEVIVPDDYNVDSEKTALLPIIDGDLYLNMDEDQFRMLIPTNQQCRNMEVTSQNTEMYSEYEMREFSRYHNEAIRQLSSGIVDSRINGAVTCARIQEDNLVFTRPVTMVKHGSRYTSGVDKIMALDSLMHESEHVRQTLEFKRDEITKPNIVVERELEAYHISYLVGQKACRLLGFDESICDYSPSFTIEELNNEFSDWCKENQLKQSVDKYIGWFHNEKQWYPELNEYKKSKALLRRIFQKKRLNLEWNQEKENALWEKEEIWWALSHTEFGDNKLLS